MAQDGTQDGGRGSGETLPRFAPWLRWGGLLGVPALAYVPALLNPLLAIDDPRYVTRNPLVLGDWSALFRFYEGE